MGSLGCKSATGCTTSHKSLSGKARPPLNPALLTSFRQARAPRNSAAEAYDPSSRLGFQRLGPLLHLNVSSSAGAHTHAPLSFCMEDDEDEAEEEEEEEANRTHPLWLSL